MNFKAQYEQLAERLTAIGINVEAVKDKLKAQHIETPSWGYGNSGTRFQVFPAAGAARTLYEKIDDASYVHSITGVAPSIAIHIPWDKVDDTTPSASTAATVASASAPSTPTSSRMSSTSWAV